MLADLRSNRGNELFSLVLKQKTDGRGGSQNLSLKQDRQSSLELSSQIRGIECEVVYIIIIKPNCVTQSGCAHTHVCCVMVHTQILSRAGLIKTYFLLCSDPWVSQPGCLWWLSGRGDSCPSSSSPKQQWGGAQRSSIPSTGIQQIPEISSPTVPEAAAATAAGNRCDTPTPLPLDHTKLLFAWFSTPSVWTNQHL